MGLVMTDRLISAIEEYGRERFHQDSNISQAQISMVCNKKRCFSPSTLMTQVIPVIWKDRHVMLSDVWQIVE